ncbi:hypothetical protein ACOMHN_019816 [Nucella lapillus]
MNIRGKSSPIQSNIRTVPTPTRGQTPPPGSQIRTMNRGQRRGGHGGGHFEDPSHYQAHYQTAGPAYQPSQQAYIDMNKPATGRVSGPGLAQGPQSFNVPRGQHPAYNLVGDSQDQQQQQMWNTQQIYPAQSLAFLPGQNMRQQQRMPTAPMNSNQVTFVPGMNANMANMGLFPGNMAHSYSGGQPLSFMPNPNSQFMQYSQPRMPFAAALPQQQQQMGFMQQQYGPANTAYAPTPAYYPPTPMHIPNTSRPSSAGPQGAMGPKPLRNRRMLILTDPTTGEDLTEKVFNKPTGGEESSDPAMLVSQVGAHREAVHLEFATKVAILAKDKTLAEGSHAIQIMPPHSQGPEAAPVHTAVHPPVHTAVHPPVHPPVHPAVHPAVMAEEHPVAAPLANVPPHSGVAEQQQQQQQQQAPMPVMNGEPEANIPEQGLSAHPPVVPYSTPAKEEFEPSPPQAAETAAAAAPPAPAPLAPAPDVQTPSPALPAAPSMPTMVSDMPPPTVNVVPKMDVPPPPSSRLEMAPPPRLPRWLTRPPLLQWRSLRLLLLPRWRCRQLRLFRKESPPPLRKVWPWWFRRVQLPPPLSPRSRRLSLQLMMPPSPQRRQQCLPALLVSL